MYFVGMHIDSTAFLSSAQLQFLMYQCMGRAICVFETLFLKDNNIINS